MKKRFLVVIVVLFCAMFANAAWAIPYPPHRVLGAVSATGDGSLDGCTAEIAGVGTESVADGAYRFDVPIYDAQDNPSGIPIGTVLRVVIKKDGIVLVSKSFTVEWGGATRLDFTVPRGPAIIPLFLTILLSD